MLGRLIRDIVVTAVWAAALTALALGSTLIGAALSVLGVTMLLLVHQGRSGLVFGAASKPSTTSADGL